MKISETEMLARKQRILDTAFRLFCERGIDRVAFVQIARRARVSESTVYRYFTNKPQMVLATLSVLWVSIGKKFHDAAVAREGYMQMSGIDQATALLEMLHDVYMQNVDYVLFSYEAKLYLQRSGVVMHQQEIDRLIFEVKGPFMRALQKGVADGSITLKESPEDMFYAIWGATRGYTVKMVLYDRLCHEANPWPQRYHVLRNGIVRAIAAR